MAAPKLQFLVTNFLQLAEVSMNSPRPSLVQTLITTAHQELQYLLIGRLSDYRPAKPTPAINSQVTSDVANILSPYWQSVAMTLGGDVWEVPDDPLGITKIMDVRPTFSDGKITSCRVLTNAEYRDRIYSEAAPPTTREPIAEYAGLNKFAISPAPTSVQAIYYQAPEAVTVIFADGAFDWDAMDDVLWQWGRPLNFLTYIMLRNYGVPLNQPFMIQTGQELAKLTM